VRYQVHERKIRARPHSVTRNDLAIDGGGNSTALFIAAAVFALFGALMTSPVVLAFREDLLSQMTLREQVSLLTGTYMWYTVPVERLGIPSFW